MVGAALEVVAAASVDGFDGANSGKYATVRVAIRAGSVSSG